MRVALLAVIVVGVTLVLTGEALPLACLTLQEARASGPGYPHWTYEHRRAGDRKCWYVSSAQLQALREPNRYRPRRAVPPRDPPPPPSKLQPAEPIEVDVQPISPQRRIDEMFNELAAMETPREQARSAGRDAAWRSLRR